MGLDRSRSGGLTDALGGGSSSRDMQAATAAARDALVAAPAPAPMHPPPAHMPSDGLSSAVVAAGRRLKIIEHRVHKVEARTKENGEHEEELVVSNLRPFTVKVGVFDHLDQPVHDCSLPLRASLLYENGLPVKQTSTSEPLLVGETDVVALQGSATFKLRITSLSSHRDKQRFRIQVAPQELELQLSETNLCVVTDPMKSVTKLGRNSQAQGAAAGGAGVAPPPSLPMPGAEAQSAMADGMKRKYRETIEDHAQQLQSLQDMQEHILAEVQSLMRLASKRQSTAGSAEGPG
jgi:hypothetical protein